MSETELIKETTAIILPSLDPDYKFAEVVKGLVEAGFAHIVIVDDGSDEAHQSWFAQAEAFPACTVLHHGINKGKGRALKTAFSYVREHLPEVKGVITIDEFKKTELRVAEVVTAERVPKTDKLMKLTLTLGDETREVVSGIADVYTAEELVGKHVILVANLKPAKLRGIVSHGMVLAASDGEKLRLIETDMPAGSVVR